jgi:hypothetical protein
MYNTQNGTTAEPVLRTMQGKRADFMHTAFETWLCRQQPKQRAKDSKKHIPFCQV